jgi:hypothetical protein
MLTHQTVKHTQREGIGMGSIEEMPGLVRSLYELVRQLESHFPERKFTLDGHLVGSIGEVLAAHQYGLELLPASAKGHDAIAPDKRQVQIKATQAKSVGLRSEPEHLIVLKLAADGTATEIYNGPGALPWHQAGKKQKNGQRPIGVSRLELLMARVEPADRMASVGSG